MREIALREAALRTGRGVRELYRQAGREGWRWRDADLGELHDMAYTRLFRVEDMPEELRAELCPEPPPAADHGVRVQPRKRREFMELGA